MTVKKLAKLIKIQKTEIYLGLTFGNDYSKPFRICICVIWDTDCHHAISAKSPKGLYWVMFPLQSGDREREFAMAAASVGDTLGIALAALTAFPAHSYFCSLWRSPGATPRGATPVGATLRATKMVDLCSQPHSYCQGLSWSTVLFTPVTLPWLSFLEIYFKMPLHIQNIFSSLTRSGNPAVDGACWGAVSPVSQPYCAADWMSVGRIALPQRFYLRC